MFSGLQPWLRYYAEYLYQVALMNGLQPRVTSVFRSRARQAVLYDRYLRGLTDYPVAPPGQSKHQYGLAFDMVTANNAALGALWNQMGGRWSPSDDVHYEV